MKFAPTNFVAVIAIVQTWFVPAGRHAPVHFTNANPGVGVAVSVTVLNFGNCATHVPELQVMPVGEEVTVPCFIIVTLSFGWITNVAVAVFEAVIVTWQTGFVPAGRHAPVHRLKSYPAAGVAVSVTACSGRQR